MKLPNPVHQMQDTVKDQQVRENDVKAKERMKANADRVKNAKESKKFIGDTVLVRQRKHNKFSTRYDPKPYRITRINGTMVTASRPGHSITRNISFYKTIQPQPGKEEWQDSDNMTGDLSGNVADEINQDRDNEVQGRRYPQRDRQPTQRYGQNIYE